MDTSGKNWKTLLSLLLVGWQAVAFVVCEAIGLKANNSVDYIQLYSGDKETLTVCAAPLSEIPVLFCRATLIMSPCGDIRNVPFWGRYDNRNVP